MSHKLARKIRQLYRRDVKKVAEKELSIPPYVLKERKWWFPRWLWKLGIQIFINRKELEEIIKNQNHAKKN